jgi:hypothetical protein
MKYTVLRDTREKDKQGWIWEPSKLCNGTVAQGLSTGDYTIEGFENIFVIERKGSISEWAGNVVQARFTKELERLSALPYAWILLEFNMSDVIKYPAGSGIPKSMWRRLKFTGPFILKKMTEMVIKYKVPIWLCGDQGKEVASNIFKRMIECRS